MARRRGSWRSCMAPGALHRLVADEPDVGDAQALGAGEHFGDVLVFDQLVRPDVKLGLLGGVGRLQQLHFERSEEHTSELQSLMRISSAVFCLKKTNQKHK